MKKLLFFLTMCMAFSFVTILTGQGTYNPNQIIIDFADEATQQDIDDYLDLINGVIIDQIGDDIFLVEVESFPIEYTDFNGVEVVLYNVVDIIENHQSNSEIDDTDLNYYVSSIPMDLGQIVESLPTDNYTPIPGYVDDYPGLLNCSSISQNQKVKVGIIDTGIDHYHSFITDYIIYENNVYNNDFTAIDDHGHGTSVAGIIAGLAQSAGITPEYLELYIIKAFDENGQGSYFNMIRAVEMANELDLDILNLSWGFSYDIFPSGTEGIYFLQSGASELKNLLNIPSDRIIICGSGNSGLEITNENLMNGFTGFHYGPADFFALNDHHLTVGSLNHLGKLAGFSNFGSGVDVYAPGTEILTPTLSGYWTLNNSGTSFSSAITTGVAVQYYVSWVQQAVDAYTNPILGNLGSSVNSGSNVDFLSLLSAANFSYLSVLKNAIEVDRYTIESEKGTKSYLVNGIDLSSLCDKNLNQSLSKTIINNVLLLEGEIEKSQMGEKNFELFPNPVSDNIEIKLLNFEKGIISIELLDQLGRQIYSDLWILDEKSDFAFKKLEVGSFNIPKGLYILRINEKGRSISKAIFKN
ncbi:MAG: S8 family serine peptidase [Saprospiraceae bacterium]|nr:S8 family serine peptidase [Saprospiraceae bacterium]MCB9324175.1 S8 family serine peptidase [Lewinellaceae bacterium]